MVSTFLLFSYLYFILLRVALTSPTAKSLPLGLIETLVTALILSLEDHARGLPLSPASLDGDPFGRFK